MQSFKSFYKKTITEGGNVKVFDTSANKVIGSQKIDLTKLNRSVIKKDVLEMIETLNNLFNKKYGEPLWKDFNSVKNSLVFTGSTASLFDPNITDEDYVKAKAMVGDIDITIPERHQEKVSELLKTLINKPVTNKISYVGSNESTAIKHDQINVIFRYKYDEENIVDFQLDFEFLPYEEDDIIPTKFSSFARSSDFSDVKEGIKGVFHKYLLSTVTNVLSSVVGDIVVITPSSKVPETPSDDHSVLKQTKASKDGSFNDNLHTFSVYYGVRDKYEPVLYTNGEQVKLDGKLVFRKTKIDKEDLLNKTKDSKFISNMFTKIFEYTPNEKEVKALGSYIGILNVLKNNKETLESKYGSDIINKVFDQFLHKWILKQKLEEVSKGDKDYDFRKNIDKTNKMAALNKFTEIITDIKPDLDKSMSEIEEYYDNY